ncbi:hypothetical protein GCM10020000_42930 [Streptomyces olivoverticillatus]
MSISPDQTVMPASDEMIVEAVEAAVVDTDTDTDTAAEPTEAAEPTITFGDLGLDDAIVRKLAQNGVTTPFPIQAATIPDALARQGHPGPWPHRLRQDPLLRSAAAVDPGGRPHREEAPPAA